MIGFGFPVDVHRPVEDVFAFIADPSNLPEWQLTDRVEQLTPGPVATGTRLSEKRTLLGRRIESISEVTCFDPGRRLDVRVVSVYARVTDRWTFEPLAGGTRVQFSTEGEARALFRPIERVIAVVMERRRREHHARLEQAMERRAAND